MLIVISLFFLLQQIFNNFFRFEKAFNEQSKKEQRKGARSIGVFRLTGLKEDLFNFVRS